MIDKCLRDETTMFGYPTYPVSIRVPRKSIGELQGKSCKRGVLNFLRMREVDWFFYPFYVPRCQHDDGYIDGRSYIKVHTDERTQVHSAWSSLMVTHPNTNRGRRCSTSVNEPLS